MHVNKDKVVDIKGWNRVNKLYVWFIVCLENHTIWVFIYKTIHTIKSTYISYTI
jgi:hypothetical protein